MDPSFYNKNNKLYQVCKYFTTHPSYQVEGNTIIGTGKLCYLQSSDCILYRWNTVQIVFDGYSYEPQQITFLGYDNNQQSITIPITDAYHFINRTQSSDYVLDYVETYHGHDVGLTQRQKVGLEEIAYAIEEEGHQFDASAEYYNKGTKRVDVIQECTHRMESKKYEIIGYFQNAEITENGDFTFRDLVHVLPYKDDIPENVPSKSRKIVSSLVRHWDTKLTNTYFLDEWKGLTPPFIQGTLQQWDTDPPEARTIAEWIECANAYVSKFKGCSNLHASGHASEMAKIHWSNHQLGVDRHIAVFLGEIYKAFGYQVVYPISYFGTWLAIQDGYTLHHILMYACEEDAIAHQNILNQLEIQQNKNVQEVSTQRQKKPCRKMGQYL